MLILPNHPCPWQPLIGLCLCNCVFQKMFYKWNHRVHNLLFSFHLYILGRFISIHRNCSFLLSLSLSLQKYSLYICVPHTNGHVWKASLGHGGRVGDSRFPPSHLVVTVTVLSGNARFPSLEACSMVAVGSAPPHPRTKFYPYRRENYIPKPELENNLLAGICKYCVDIV